MYFLSNSIIFRCLCSQTGEKLNCYDEDNIFNASTQQAEKIENAYNMEGPEGSEVGLKKQFTSIYPHPKQVCGFSKSYVRSLLNSLSNKT